MDNQHKISRKENLNSQKRNSILKEAVEMETNEIKSEIVCNSKRRVSFADTTSIKEFLVLRDANTEWNCTYEEPILYESSSSINSTNATFLMNKQVGIEQGLEENSVIVPNLTSNIEDSSFSKFLSGFLEINTDSRKSEDCLDEKSCEDNMELTCNANVCFKTFDSAYLGNAKDESKNLDISPTLNCKEDKTSIIQKSLDITCFSNQPFDFLNQSSNSSLQSSDLKCNNSLNKYCNLDDQDASKNSSLNCKHFFTPASEFTSSTHIIGVETTKPTFEEKNNEGNVSFKANGTDMDLTTDINSHLMKNFVTKVNNCIPRKLGNFEVLNNSSIEFEGNRNSLFKESNQMNSFMFSSTLNDDVFYCQEEKPSKAFDQVKNNLNAEVKSVDMSLTVVGDILKDNVFDFEGESVESKCDKRNIEGHSKDMICVQSIDKTLNKISVYSLAPAETKNYSILNTSLPEMPKVKLSDLKIMENKKSRKAQERFDNSSANSIIDNESLPSDFNKGDITFTDELCFIKELQNSKENTHNSLKLTMNDKGNQQENFDSLEKKTSDYMFEKVHEMDHSLSNQDISINCEVNKNSNVVYSEETIHLPLKLLEYSRTSSKDKCSQDSHPEKRFEEQANNQISQAHESKIKVPKTIDKTCINVVNSDIGNSLTRPEDVINLLTNTLEDQKNFSTISLGRKCDLQNVSPSTLSCRHLSFNEQVEHFSNSQTNLNTLNLSECANETSERFQSLSQSSFENLEDITMDLMDCEPVECSHPTVSYVDTVTEREASLSINMCKVHNQKTEKTLETIRKRKLVEEINILEVQEEKSQYGEIDKNIVVLHAFQKVAKKEAFLPSSQEERKMLHCKQCDQHKLYTNLEKFNIDNLKNDEVSINIEKPQLKLKLYLTLHENHLFICGTDLKTQMQNSWQKDFTFVSKAFDHYFQQLNNEIINTRLCEGEILLEKFLKSYQQILSLLRDIYFLKVCFPSFAKDNYFHILVMSAKKHILVNLKVQIGFHTSQDIFSPHFSVEPNIKIGNLRKKIVEETIKKAISMEYPTLLNIIKAVYQQISSIM